MTRYTPLGPPLPAHTHGGTDAPECTTCGTDYAPTPTPTPIDPADIRPGDVVERRLVDRVTVLRNEGDVMRGTRPDGGPVGLSTEIPTATWHLIHRPDPDAEAVEAIDRATTREGRQDTSKREWSADTLAALREQGWDVVRRAES